MAAPEAIYGVHENHSVKRSGQAGGAARAEGRSRELTLIGLEHALTYII
ncbi:hypothetical protein CS509_002433 [Salmonella enterica subsp. enterica serovar Uganda]|nr:hypothetical protein [Salmonella enterica subsp. enterica serovar Uganda]EDS9506468.1 hypothetical protein [Salmonella enterica subsp. enterica]EDY3426110.1 hypothetical protein [Salmonella enterica]DAY54982.1 MAG TPA: hypothetical protein [Caudoviricetes sp.]EDR1047803.1 hypothetical protein [Salmonella enterica subsp. enterica serovar Uganda]